MHEAYDIHGVQEKWLPIWDELTPFRSGRPDDKRPKKYCRFKKLGIKYIDYKDPEFLKKKINWHCICPQHK